MRTILPLVLAVPIAVDLASAQIRTPGALAHREILTGHAAQLYHQAERGKWFAEAAALHAEVLPTSDGQSFFVVWKGSAEPKRWIVSLPGSRGLATDDLAVWHPHLKDRQVGLLVLQWWMGGSDDTSAYYRPEQIYREVDLALQKLKIEPGSVMLHGFSRGSANSYAVAALDSGRGKHYFALSVASSGGVALDYPPTHALVDGKYGDRPLQGTRWITSAGARDPNPERDGVPGMRRTAEWLRTQGAAVLESIEDPSEGHGALQRNGKNAARVLDAFFKFPLPAHAATK